MNHPNRRQALVALSPLLPSLLSTTAYAQAAATFQHCRGSGVFQPEPHDDSLRSSFREPTRGYTSSSISAPPIGEA